MGEITGLGFNDISVGAEIFDMLKVDRDALTDSKSFSKIQDIAKFASRTADPVFVLRTAMAKYHGQDPLPHLWAFVQLAQRKELIAENKKKIDQDVAAGKWKDADEQKKMEAALDAARTEEKNADLELEFYK